MLDNFLSDFRFALRSLLARPGFVATAVATLALGIGANTAIFSVVNGLLLKPLPYDDGERLVEVYNSYPSMGLEYAGSSIPDFLDRKEQAAGLEDLALYTGQSYNLSVSGAPQRLVGLVATPSLFSTLRGKPLLGRAFSEAEAEAGKEKVVVLGYNTWKNLFAADRNIVGSAIRLNGESFQVLGVMPEDFVFPNRDTQLWTPFVFSAKQRSDDERGNEFSQSIGRLKAGVSVEQLNSQFDAIVQHNADRIAAATGGADAAEFYRSGKFQGRAKSLREQWVGPLRPALWMLQAVVAFVLLIACANVANLMLARVLDRQKELSVRSALGASRSRIVTQILLEAVLLSFIGAIAGVMLAYWSLGLLKAMGLNQTQLSGQIGIDASVLLFSVGLAVATGLLFGLFPALMQFGGRSYEVLKEGGRGNSGGKAARVTRSALVVVQLALAVTLLIGAGLLIRSFDRVLKESPGFVSDGVVSFRIDLPQAKYKEKADQARVFERMVSEVAAVPGVSQIGYVSNLPFTGNNWTASYEIEGRTTPANEASPHGYVRVIDEGFFKTMGMNLLQGRGFEVADNADSQKVAVVDALLAKKYFPNGDALGKRIRLNGNQDEWFTIVGVVGNIRPAKLTEELTKESYYLDYRQFPQAQGSLIVKTRLPTGSLIEPIRQAVLRVDSEQPVYDIKTLDERIRMSLDTRRAPMLLLVVFAGVALLLSAIGIYGVLAFAVTQRTGELGIRMAIGAGRREIVGLVMGDGARLTGIGLAIGVVGAFVLTRFMQAQLFGVSAGDPLTFIGVVLLLAAVAWFACYVPARRAAGVDPLIALRHE